MEAIIQDSGRQFKVREGATIEVDYRDVPVGSAIEFGDVLYVNRESMSDPGAGAEDTATESSAEAPGGSSKSEESPVMGTPTVPGARVVGRVVGTVKGPKLVAASFRRRKNSRRRIGHRQKYTRVHIESIEV